MKYKELLFDWIENMDTETQKEVCIEFGLVKEATKGVKEIEAKINKELEANAIDLLASQTDTDLCIDINSFKAWVQKTFINRVEKLKPADNISELQIIGFNECKDKIVSLLKSNIC